MNGSCGPALQQNINSVNIIESLDSIENCFICRQNPCLTPEKCKKDYELFVIKYRCEICQLGHQTEMHDVYVNMTEEMGNFDNGFFDTSIDIRKAKDGTECERCGGDHVTSKHNIVISEQNRRRKRETGNFKGAMPKGHAKKYIVKTAIRDSEIKNKSEEDAKKEIYLQSIDCWECGEKGHYAFRCPKKQGTPNGFKCAPIGEAPKDYKVPREVEEEQVILGETTPPLNENAPSRESMVSHYMFNDQYRMDYVVPIKSKIVYRYDFNRSLSDNIKSATRCTLSNGLGNVWVVRLVLWLMIQLMPQFASIAVSPVFVPLSILGGLVSGKPRQDTWTWSIMRKIWNMEFARGIWYGLGKIMIPERMLKWERDLSLKNLPEGDFLLPQWLKYGKAVIARNTFDLAGKILMNLAIAGSVYWLGTKVYNAFKTRTWMNISFSPVRENNIDRIAKVEDLRTDSMKRVDIKHDDQRKMMCHIRYFLTNPLAALLNNVQIDVEGIDENVRERRIIYNGHNVDMPVSMELMSQILTVNNTQVSLDSMTAWNKLNTSTSVVNSVNKNRYDIEDVWKNTIFVSYYIYMYYKWIRGDLPFPQTPTTHT